MDERAAERGHPRFPPLSQFLLVEWIRKGRWGLSVFSEGLHAHPDERVVGMLIIATKGTTISVTSTCFVGASFVAQLFVVDNLKRR